YGLKSLVRLHMDHNQIEFVNPNVFYGLTLLRLVHLEGNLLKQLHPDTFVTLRYSQIFKISFIKHIYLSDNALLSLPQDMLSYMAELESLYLHGNPWCCDCSLQWLAEWATQRADIIKCKKDRSSGAQQCPVCASPRSRRGKSVVDLPAAALTCAKPAIQDALKLENVTMPEDGELHPVSPRDFMAPIGSVVLNMTDQAGNRGNLACSVQKPKEMSPISFDKEGNSTVLKASFSAFLMCGIDYEHIQQLWSILALYSNSPLKLERNTLVTNMPFTSYKYKQIYSDKDELFTNTEAELRAEPPWLMQSKVALQLDRTATTLNMLHIQYFTDAQIVLPSTDKSQDRNTWVIISRDNTTQTEHTVLVGGTVELPCRAVGEPAPAVEWILADGSKVRAPYVSEDGRIVVVKSGTFTLRTADAFDSGLYHCIGTNYNDGDALTFRITVVDPYEEHNSANGAQLSAFVGSMLYLPCTSTAVPDAAISWVLPEHTILHHSEGNKHVFDNGTLRIQGVTERDSGYFRCVAANPYGVDILVFQVLVRKDETTLKKTQAAGGEWAEGDGSGHAVPASATTQMHSLAPPPTLTAPWESAVSAARNQVAQSARMRNRYRKVTYRHYQDRAGRRFRGHRRQFVSSARRVDPQRWAALLEKTKRNSTSTGKQVATKPPVQVRKFSEAPGDEEETSGDIVSPEEEFMIPVTRTAVPALGRAMKSVVTAGPGAATSNAAAGKGSLLVAEAGTPLPSPFSQSVPSGLSQVSANGIKPSSAVSYAARRTPTLSTAGQGLVYSGESNNQHVKSVSMAPVTEVTDTSKSVTSQNAADELHVFTESIDKISTKTDPQLSVVAVSEPSPGFDRIYFHSTHKQVTPRLPLASTAINDQQVQIVQDFPTQTPPPQQQYGRRRKISGRRRIVRPGRIPGMKEHKYNLGRNSTAVAAGVQLNMKYVSNLPTLNNISSSINLMSPEAPLSSPSTMNMPLEHPAGTQQSTAFPRENEASARHKTTTTAMSFTAKSAHDTPQGTSGTSAAFQANTNRVQSSSVRLPTAATHTALAATGITQTKTTETSSALESVTHSKLPNQQTDVFPSPEVPTALPKTTAGLSLSKVSPLRFTPVSTGENHSSAFLSLNKPIPYGNGNGNLEEHLPTAKPHSYSNLATGATKEMDVTSLKPPVIPIITLQTDTKITKSKVFRVGRKRGQRRRRPPKISPSQSTTAGYGTTGRDEDKAEKRSDQETTTTSPKASDSLSRNHFAKPRIIGGRWAAFTVLAGSDAFIPCEATGDPRPTIQWTKILPGLDAAAGRGVGRWRVFANGTLALVRASLGDRGQYLCTAANLHGVARLLVTLSVLAFPPRVAGPRWQLLTAHSGKALAVPCRAEGRPPPAIAWVLANKTHVSSSSAGNGRARVELDGTLVIQEVTVYDRGLYTCVAKNPAGTDTRAVKLQVIAAPPTILEEKRQRLEGATGENLRLPCTVQGKPQPSVHWVLSDGTVVKPLQFVKAKLFLFPNGTLHLSSVGPADSGTYECIATSSTGSERRVVSLMVQHRDVLPKIAMASPEMTRLNFGDKLLLNCTATGEPKPSIIWRLPSKAVVDQWHRMGSRIHVYPNGSLAVESVTEKDAGDYLCVARNKIGDDLVLMRVSITMKPAKIDQKQYFKKLVPYGKDFQVDCKASGSPAPEISWGLPDGTVINNAMLADDSGRRSRRYILFDNGTLYLNKAGVTEGGDYTCYAQNTLGRDEMKIRITVVMTAPQIKHNYKTYRKVRAGDTAVLDCEAAGEPKPEIFWLLPSSDMISSSTARHVLHGNGSLSVSQARLLDAGDYTCVAHNPGGDDTKLYKLDVVARPPIINGLYGNKTIMKVTAVRHSKKQIDCQAEGTPLPQIMWIMPDNIFLTAPYYGSRIVVHENGTLEIRNLRPSDTADFICVARNDGGESMLVVQLEVLEMLRRPTFKNPFNEKIIAKPGKPTTLNCSVDGNPPPDISWMLPNGTWFSGSIKTSQFVTGSGGTLTIYNSDGDKAGKYRCAARNQVGYIEKLMVLEVGRKPSILTRPQGPVQGASGEVLSLHCLSEGSPRPSTAWTLPGGSVLARPQLRGKHVLLENGTLVIRDATLRDSGDYVCTAHNAAGDASVTIPVVIVAYAPRITHRPPHTVRAVPGAPFQLHCAALGVPKPEISWELPDRSVLSPGHPGQVPGIELLRPLGTLLIPSPLPSDSGTYKCTAKNHLGSDFTVTYVHVI
ncbi:PREDICTED: immunoglobulin superfamily member 10, partial [Mesitornis unicolor]|uniref:immunoglobulin superfamily member 10 n=1 Tax=Mesitornis unicolor TaxID=54374 RepID=UPI000529143F